MLPLLWFIHAARRLPLNAVGLFQYIGPTLSFLLAVFLFGEVFTAVHALTFGCIWTGLALSTFDSLARARRMRVLGQARIATDGRGGAE